MGPYPHHWYSEQIQIPWFLYKMANQNSLVRAWIKVMIKKDVKIGPFFISAANVNECIEVIEFPDSFHMYVWYSR